MGIQPDNDDYMVDVPESKGLDTSEDPIRLEPAFIILLWMVARKFFHVGDHLMMMMTMKVESVERVVKRATLLASQQSILVGHQATPIQILGTILNTTAMNQWQTRRVGWKMTWWTTTMIHTSQPCVANHMPPLILFSMQTRALLKMRCASISFFYIIFGFPFFSGLVFYHSYLVVSILCLIFIISMTGVVRKSITINP